MPFAKRVYASGFPDLALLLVADELLSPAVGAIRARNVAFLGWIGPFLDANVSAPFCACEPRPLFSSVIAESVNHG